MTLPNPSAVAKRRHRRQSRHRRILVTPPFPPNRLTAFPPCRLPPFTCSSHAGGGAQQPFYPDLCEGCGAANTAGRCSAGCGFGNPGNPGNLPNRLPALPPSPLRTEDTTVSEVSQHGDPTGGSVEKDEWRLHAKQVSYVVSTAMTMVDEKVRLC